MERYKKIRDEKVQEALLQMQRGQITRRDFIRYAAMMGASIGLAGCQAAASEPVEKTVIVNKEVEVVKTVEVEKITTATPEPTATGGVKRGGSLNTSFFFSTERFNDPAIINNYFVSNTLRQVCEYLVRVTPEMVVVPSLATSWTPSDDGKVWIVDLRKNVKFNHGKDFTADDVVFTYERLLNPDTGSGFTSIANYLKPGSVEKVDDFQVRFHCDRAVADFPYHLFSYMAAILPTDWEGDFYKQPYGTGPFTIEEFRPDERIVFKAREDYWDIGLDGKPLPYIDELVIKNYPDDASYLDALKRGEIHLSGISAATIPEVLKMDGIKPSFFQSGGFFNAVLHCDEKPFDNPKVREALKIACDRTKWVNTVYMGYAIEGNDTPIAPIFPGAESLEPTVQNVEKAKQLLAEAGYPNGLDLDARFINDDLTTNTATWLAATAKEAGFNITLKPDPEYWQHWLEPWGDNVIGVSNWGMRSTPSEYFNITYHSTADWNESHWKNADFDEKLSKYDEEMDAATRNSLLMDLCNLIREDGGLLTAGHYQVLYAKTETLKNMNINPMGFTYYGDCWLE